MKIRGDVDFLGSRDPNQEGKPYVWKTWNQVDADVRNLAIGYHKLNLMPVVEGEGHSFRFMGCYAKNREEWSISDLAAMSMSGTVVAFYDTLGPEAVEFVIK